METKFFIGADHWSGLSKLLEEAGEVAQVGGKLIGSYGTEQHWDGTNLRDRLIEELGDLSAAINFFVSQNFSVRESQEIAARRETKMALFLKWNTDTRNG